MRKLKDGFVFINPSEGKKQKLIDFFFWNISRVSRACSHGDDGEKVKIDNEGQPQV